MHVSVGLSAQARRPSLSATVVVALLWTRRSRRVATKRCKRRSGCDQDRWRWEEMSNRHEHPVLVWRRRQRGYRVHGAVIPAGPGHGGHDKRKPGAHPGRPAGCQSALESGGGAADALEGTPERVTITVTATRADDTAEVAFTVEVESESGSASARIFDAACAVSVRGTLWVVRPAAATWRRETFPAPGRDVREQVVDYPGNRRRS